MTQSVYHRFKEGVWSRVIEYQCFQLSQLVWQQQIMSSSLDLHTIPDIYLVWTLCEADPAAHEPWSWDCSWGESLSGNPNLEKCACRLRGIWSGQDELLPFYCLPIWRIGGSKSSSEHAGRWFAVEWDILFDYGERLCKLCIIGCISHSALVLFLVTKAVIWGLLKELHNTLWRHHEFPYHWLHPSVNALRDIWWLSRPLTTFRYMQCVVPKPQIATRMEWICSSTYLVIASGSGCAMDTQSCWTLSSEVHGLAVQQDTHYCLGARWSYKRQLLEIAVREGYWQTAYSCATCTRILRGSSGNVGSVKRAQ